MRTIVLATSNPHKAAEIGAMLPEGFRIITQAEAGFSGSVAETESTIHGNSLLKAQAVKRYLEDKGNHAWVMADDSGLEVKALDGAPGVHSARYAGEPANDEKNIEKLLREMRQMTDRRARFVTVITLIGDNGPRFFEGQVTGTIAYQPRGKAGFGYDPVFIPTGLRSTFAEISSVEKNRISHRAKAIEALVDGLRV